MFCEINTIVRTRRFELPHPNRIPAPQAGASTNSATCAITVIVMFCDRAGARTQDPLLKREMLYQLSYQV